MFFMMRYRYIEDIGNTILVQKSAVMERVHHPVRLIDAGKA